MELTPSGTIVLVDISSIAYPIWHTSETATNRDVVSQQTVARVHNLTAGFPHAAICCDSGRTFRHEIDPTYKANRPEKEAGIQYQIDKAIERLRQDGYPIWTAKGFEADDVIATACRLARERDLSVLIISADKDLLQLVGPQVAAKSLKDGSIVDEAAVVAKFGVSPALMRDYLTLLGDASDNVPGVKGVGQVRAVNLLATFGSIDELYASMEKGEAQLTPAITQSLLAFKAQMPTTRMLITLRDDVEIAFDAIAAERTPLVSPNVVMAQTGMEVEDMAPEMTAQDTAPAPVPDAAPEAVATETPTETPAAEATTAIAKREDDPIVGEVVETSWNRQLEPRSMRDAERLATVLDKSGMFEGAYGNAPAVMTAILAGRELGMPAMSALRGIHMVEGRASLSAQTMVGLLLKSGLVDYFEMEESTDKTCTFVGKRKGARKEQRVTHTIEMATRAGLVKPNSNWVKTPEDMLVARASARLARLLVPDLLGGMYTPEELREVSA